MIELSRDFFSFLTSSPTPWHAAKEIGNHLAVQQFIPLSEGEPWKLQAGESYFVERGASTIAFRLPKKTPKRCIFLASHVDSPALKLKPQGFYQNHNLLIWGTEVYGGINSSSWLDRDLIVSGKITILDEEDKIVDRLIHLDEAMVTIPSLAVHLRKKEDESLNVQDHLKPIMGILNDTTSPEEFLPAFIKKYILFKSLLSFDLYLIPSDLPAFLGLNGELLASYRIDNLAGAYACLAAICKTEPREETMQIAAFFNHEEIGSKTSEGALSPLANDTLERIAYLLGISKEDYYIFKNASFCISVDNAHGLHPHYEQKHDTQHKPLLGKGIVIKQSASQKYATDSLSTGKIIKLCKDSDIPYQLFVSRSDQSSGSTVGPLLASSLGFPTIDIGTAQLAMHSARELIALNDERYMCLLLKNALEAL